MRLIWILIVVALGGCATTRPDPTIVELALSAERQAAGHQEAATAQAQARATLVERIAVQCNGDPACIAGGTQAIQAMALADAVAALAQGRGAGQPTLPAYQPRHWTDGAARILGALTPLGVAAVQGAVTIRQSDNSVDISAHDAATQQTLYGAAFGAATAAVDAAASASNAWAATAPELLREPSVNVGGDYVVGDGNTSRSHVGDTVGDGSATREGRIGDDIGRDVIGGDRVGDHARIGDGNRHDSPGPYDVVCTPTAGDGAPGGPGNAGPGAGTAPGGPGTGAPGGPGGAIGSVDCRVGG